MVAITTPFKETQLSLVHVHVATCIHVICPSTRTCIIPTSLRVQECRFYDFKMRPLLLVYENPDPSALLQDMHIIFKSGDGMWKLHEHFLV